MLWGLTVPGSASVTGSLLKLLCCNPSRCLVNSFPFWLCGLSGVEMLLLVTFSSHEKCGVWTCSSAKRSVQGSFMLTGRTTGTLATNVWTAATLCYCVRYVPSLQTWPSPMICSALSCPKAPPLSRSYRCTCNSWPATITQWKENSIYYSRHVSMWQTGNFCLLDYEVLDGVQANMINRKQRYLSAPLCPLHLNQQGQLLPIAIQVSYRCSDILRIKLVLIWMFCCYYKLH